MSEAYDGELQALRGEIDAGGARPSVIDRRIDALLSEGGDSLAVDLLASLSDMAEHDEGMFSIIHAVESLDETPYRLYVRALLAAFLTLMSRAPRWASIILMRVMNTDASRYELVRQLREAPAPTKEAVRVMCERINAVSPEFLSKTVPVTLAAA